MRSFFAVAVKQRFKRFHPKFTALNVKHFGIIGGLRTQKRQNVNHIRPRRQKFFQNAELPANFKKPVKHRRIENAPYLRAGNFFLALFVLVKSFGGFKRAFQFRTKCGIILVFNRAFQLAVS